MQGLPADDVMNADQSTGTLSGNAHSLEYKHTLFCSLISLFIILTDCNHSLPLPPTIFYYHP